VLDALRTLQGVVSAGVLRSWSVLDPKDLAFLVTVAAASIATLLWRRSCPASYARNRELPAVILRVAAAASPAAWKVTAQALHGTPPYGSSWPLNAAAFALAVLFSSFAATGGVMVRARMAFRACICCLSCYFVSLPAYRFWLLPS
jgi:hypothetical protein